MRNGLFEVGQLAVLSGIGQVTSGKGQDNLLQNHPLIHRIRRAFEPDFIKR